MLKVLYIFLIAVSSSVLWDFLFYLYKLFGKKRIKVKDYFFKVYTSFSFITGGIISLLLPIGVELYFVPAITFVSVVFGKLIFGGIGKNLFNPALLGVVIFLLIFKPNYYLGEIDSNNSFILELYKTPLYQTFNFPSSYGAIRYIYGFSLWDIFNGFYIGEIGTTNSFALIIILFYLIARKIIDFRLSLIYLFSYFVLSLLLFGLSKNNLSMLLYNSFTYLIVGPALITSTFLISDPSSSPLIRGEKILYSLVVCTVTFYLRLLLNNVAYFYLGILGCNLLFGIISRVDRAMKLSKVSFIASIILSVLMIASVFAYLGFKNMLFFQ